MKKLWNEFKAFAFKGNVVDLAVGMMIGSAFTAIVTGLVNSVLMPLLSLITGKVNFEDMKWVIGGQMETVDGVEQLVGATEIPYGTFIQAVINFFLIAICIFFVVKAINKAKKKPEEKPAEAPRLCPFCFQEIHKDATRCPHCTSELK